MELLILSVPALLLIALVVVLLVLGDRSLKRQKGNMLERDEEEKDAADGILNRLPRSF